MSAHNRRLVISARARADLSDILLYTDRRWGSQQMRAYNRALTDAFAELQRFPHLGRPRPDYGQGYRSFPMRQHAIIYEITDTEITVMRLLHVRRDAEGQVYSTTDE
jgi:toxin ParE1/3/4